MPYTNEDNEAIADNDIPAAPQATTLVVHPARIAAMTSLGSMVVDTEEEGSLANESEEQGEDKGQIGYKGLSFIR
jgi:hypothetical protein